jgi:fructosamine-3-kinase
MISFAQQQSTWFPEGPAIVQVTPVSGGCINRTEWVTLSDGSRYFVKSNPAAPARMFEAEAGGLSAIAGTQAIRVPQIVKVGQSNADHQNPDQSFLILEAIKSGPRPKNFSETFGHQLAELHRRGTRNEFGFSTDNFLGSTPQSNAPTENWAEFWWIRRLEFQLKLAVDNGFGEALTRYRNRLATTVENRIGPVNEPPALIHGDLWSGNYLIDTLGAPVLIDPAVYYAHRECEFGMTTLFGGLNQSFYDAYDQAWPLPDGWQDRVELYRLYHLLNHLNLFGATYLASCLEIIKQY